MIISTWCCWRVSLRCQHILGLCFFLAKLNLCLFDHLLDKLSLYWESSISPLFMQSRENSLKKGSLALVYFMISQSSSRSATTVNLRMSDPCPSQPCWRLPYRNQWRDYSCLLECLPPLPQPEGKDLQSHFQPGAHLSAAVRLALAREVPTETILASLFNLHNRRRMKNFWLKY